MMITRGRILVFLVMAIAWPHMAHAQDERFYELDDVIVVAGRTPVAFSDLARSVTVIGADEIAGAPVGSVAELLGQTLSVDVRRRGPFGIQADMSIRGATSEQTLVMIDGIKLSDIRRVEVLEGPGSRLYGGSAMGGVVNIVTAQDHRRSAYAVTAIGEHGLIERSAGLSLPIGKTSHRLSASLRTCDGYRPGTEFDATMLSYATRLRTSSGSINLAARYSDKEFGAYGFYSDNFPNEWEATEVLFLNSGADLQLGRFSVSPKFFWRRHKDDFILDRDRPDWYRNRHTTDQYGAELHTAIESSWGITAFGAELTEDEITSSSLGSHTRKRGGVFLEHRVSPTRNLSLVPGLAVYSCSGYGWSAWPGLDIGYQLTRHVRVYSSVGRSFRIPTYTELFYVSPANVGNPDLQPEKATSVELGTRLSAGRATANMVLFMREGRDLIDWTRSDPEEPWQVRNVSKVTTRGFELGGALRLRDDWEQPGLLDRLSARYAFLDSDRETGVYESKYVLDHLRHQVIMKASLIWLSDLRQSWTVRYLMRPGGDEFTVVDTRLSFKYRQAELFVEASNLFDASYVEVGSIPMPGRWLRAGLKFNSGGP